MKSAFSLAARAEKRTSLGLDDPADRAGTTSFAGQTGSIIDTMKILISTFAVERVAVRPVAQRAPLLANRLLQYVRRRLLNAIPLGTRQPITTSAGIDTGQKQNLRRIQIPDTRHRRLIEQRDLHGASTLAQRLAKLLRRDQQRIDTEFRVDEL